MVIAHRGASSYAPENTVSAFDLAIEMGVSHIELDVHATSDGHIVVIHDETVDRTTSGSGPVTSHPLAALAQLDAGSWFQARFAGARIPTFSEVLERYKGRVYIPSPPSNERGSRRPERMRPSCRRVGSSRRSVMRSSRRRERWD